MRNEQQGGCAHEYARRHLQSQNKEGPFSGRAGREGVRDPSGGIALGKRRDRAKHGNAEALVEAVQRVHQHAAGVAAQARLPMLRHAARGRHHQPRERRNAQRKLLPVVLRRRNLHVQQHGRPDRGVRQKHGGREFSRGAGPRIP